MSSYGIRIGGFYIEEVIMKLKITVLCLKRSAELLDVIYGDIKHLC